MNLRIGKYILLPELVLSYSQHPFLVVKKTIPRRGSKFSYNKKLLKRFSA